MAVVVVVADYAAKAIAGARHAGLFGHVCERAIAIVPIQSVARHQTPPVEIARAD